MIIPGSDPLATLQHARSTITFLNSSGTVDVFTITGRVHIKSLTAYVATTVVEDGAVTGIELGGATDPNAFIVSTDPAALLTTLWWYDATPTGGPVQMDALQIDAMTDEDIILTITGGTDLNSGVIVFDVWYYPVTDDGALVAA
jgi:hypothetical protein